MQNFHLTIFLSGDVSPMLDPGWWEIHSLSIRNVDNTCLTLSSLSPFVPYTTFHHLPSLLLPPSLSPVAESPTSGCSEASIAKARRKREKELRREKVITPKSNGFVLHPISTVREPPATFYPHTSNRPFFKYYTLWHQWGGKI